MNSLPALLGARRRGLIGVVHLLPTPGSPGASGSFEELLARARSDARALVQGGADALLLENFGDTPFFAESVPSETVASLALALREVLSLSGDLPVGVNVLRNDVRAALGLCAVTGASFVRVNVHTGAMVSDQGLLQGRAAETLRTRERLCPGVAILADVHVKHAAPLGGESLVDAAEDCLRRGRADALVLSGARTGAPPARSALLAVRERIGSAPLLVGSGLDEHNATELCACANAAIVGTALQRGGISGAPIEEARVARLRAVLDRIAD